MWWTFASMVSVFSSKLKDLQAWNNCSLVFPILEYCCLNKFCNSHQSTFIGSNDWYHNLASPNSLRQNLWTFTLSTKWCAFIQSFEWEVLLLYPHQVSLKILVWNLTSLKNYLLLLFILWLWLGLWQGWGEIWCWNTFFMICHLCLMLSFSLSLIYSYFILSFLLWLCFCLLWLCHVRFTTSCLIVYSHS